MLDNDPKEYRGPGPPFPMEPSVWAEVATSLSLSPQQTQIVELILRGRQDKEIAVEMGLSFSTVRTYLTRIFNRTGVPDRLSLVLLIFAKAQQIARGRCR